MGSDVKGGAPLSQAIVPITPMTTPRRSYCRGSAERLGIACRFCSPTRVERHEAACRGLRNWWHTLSGEHVRLAIWDWKEAKFMEERVWERVAAFEVRLEELEKRHALLLSVAAAFADASGETKGAPSSSGSVTP